MKTLMIASTLDVLCYFTPIASTILKLSHDQLIILLSSPVALDNVWVEHYVPPLVALLLCPSPNMLSYSSPILSTIDSHSLS